MLAVTSSFHKRRYGRYYVLQTDGKRIYQYEERREISVEIIATILLCVPL
jgi:hypothetical protein